MVETIDVGGDRGSDYAHAEGIAADPRRDRVYVAVTDRDLVAVIDTDAAEGRALRRRRPPGAGRSASAPVSPAVAPDGDTLYVANAGEDAVVGDRPRGPAGDHAGGRRARGALRARVQRRSRRYRSARAHGRSARARARRHAPGARRRFARARPRRCAGVYCSAAAIAAAAAGRAAPGPRAGARRCCGRTARRERCAPARRARRQAQRAFRARDPAARGPAEAHRTARGRASCPGADAFEVLGRLPTAAYTTDVEVTPDGRRLVWLAAKGFGTGPNPDRRVDISDLLRGRVGVLDAPDRPARWPS